VPQPTIYQFAALVEHGCEMTLSSHNKLVNFIVQKWFIITPFRATFAPFPADFPIGKCRFPALEAL
jgi:hypothetical protein